MTREDEGCHRSHSVRRQDEVWPRAQVCDQITIWEEPCLAYAVVKVPVSMLLLVASADFKISFSWCIIGMPLKRRGERRPEGDQVYTPSCDSNMTSARLPKPAWDLLRLRKADMCRDTEASRQHEGAQVTCPCDISPYRAVTPLPDAPVVLKCIGRREKLGPHRQ